MCAGWGINIHITLMTADRTRTKATSTGEQANTNTPDFFPDTNLNHLQLRWGGEGGNGCTPYSWQLTGPGPKWPTLTPLLPGHLITCTTSGSVNQCFVVVVVCLSVHSMMVILDPHPIHPPKNAALGSRKGPVSPGDSKGA